MMSTCELTASCWSFFNPGVKKTLHIFKLFFTDLPHWNLALLDKKHNNAPLLSRSVENDNILPTGRKGRSIKKF